MRDVESRRRAEPDAQERIIEGIRMEERDDLYRILIDDTMFGPMSADQVTELITQGRIARADQVSRDQGPWQPVTDVFAVPPPAADEEVAPPPPPRDEESPAAASWHYRQDGKTLGPLPAAEIKTLLARGEITDQTLVWKRDLPDWIKLSESELSGPRKQLPTIAQLRTYAPLLYRIAMGIAIFAVLCPWYRLAASGMGTSFSSSVSGIMTVCGFFTLVVAVSGQAVSFLKPSRFGKHRRWVLPGSGAMVILLALLAMLNFGSASSQFSFGGFSTSSEAGPAFGVWLALFAGVVAGAAGYLTEPAERLDRAVASLQNVLSPLPVWTIWVAGSVIVACLAVVMISLSGNSGGGFPGASNTSPQSVYAVDEEFKIAASQHGGEALVNAEVLIELRRDSHMSWESLENEVAFQFEAIGDEYKRWKKARIRAGDRYK